MSTYLPNLGIGDLFDAMYSDDNSTLYNSLSAQKYERLGVDRAFAIAADLYERYRSWKGLRILDVGCNNGLIGETLALLGAEVVGIDNDDIDTQGLYERLAGSGSRLTERHNVDLLDFLESDGRSWDCVLLLSVTHHWETGYAMSGKRRYSDVAISNVMAMLAQRTERAIYYECPVDEPGFGIGYGTEFILRFFKQPPQMRSLGNTVGPNGFLRELWEVKV